MFAILMRYLVGIGGYSGENDPPQFGDYEAQRHWFEITYNIPPYQWYSKTSYNNLSYWPLDYPPLTAYHSQLLGYLSHKFEPGSVDLLKSHGYETISHRIFMRFTVIISDALIFFPALIILILRIFKKYCFDIKYSILLFIINLPPFILIDHGHFQYNCCLLGLILWAIYFSLTGDLFYGCILFSISINFKVMGVYYSLAFLSFFLSTIIFCRPINGFSGDKRIVQLVVLKFNKLFQKQLNNFKILRSLFLILCFGIIVVLTHFILYLPWILHKNLHDVLTAIFPIKRGLYQLKVASFWCMSDIIFKWETYFTQKQLTILCALLTIMFSLPSFMMLLFSKGQKKQFLTGMFLTAMSFFFFSYHVHEKTILIPFLTLPLLIKYFGIYVIDFSIVACFTMFHLLKEDKQTFQYFIFQILSFIIGNQFISQLEQIKFIKYSFQANQYYGNSILEIFDRFYLKYIRKIVYIFMIALHIQDGKIHIQKLPYISHLFFAFLGFIFFLIVYMRMHFFMLVNFQKQFQQLEVVTLKKKEQ